MRYPTRSSSVLLVVSMMVSVGLPPLIGLHEARASSRSLHFLVTADPQYWDDDNESKDDWMNRRADDVLDKMVSWTQSDSSIRGIVVAGDLTQYTRSSEFRRYIDRIRPVYDKVYDGLGNHDFEPAHGRLCGRMDQARQAYEPDPVGQGPTALSAFLAESLDCYDRRVVFEHVARQNRETRTNNCPWRMPHRELDSDMDGWGSSFDTRNKEDYPCPHYSWDWGDVHFVQLNMYGGWNNSWSFHYENGERKVDTYPAFSALNWLADDLTSRVGTSGRPVVIIQHFQDEATEWSDEQKQQFWDVLRNYNVIMLPVGHAHPTARQEWIEPFDRPPGRTTSAPDTSCNFAQPCIRSYIAGAARSEFDTSNAFSDWYGTTDPGAFIDVRIEGNQVTVDRWGVDGDDHFWVAKDSFSIKDRPYTPIKLTATDEGTGAPLGGLFTDQGTLRPQWRLESDYLPLAWRYSWTRKPPASEPGPTIEYDSYVTECLSSSGDLLSACEGGTILQQAGSYTLRLEARDGLNRYVNWPDFTPSLVEEIKFVIDRTDPVVKLVGAGSGVVRPPVKVTPTIEEEYPASSVMTINGLNVTPKEFTFTRDGDVSLELSATDKAGNTATTSAAFTIDGSPPEISAEVTPKANDHGWHRSDVQVKLTATDEIAGVQHLTYCIGPEPRSLECFDRAEGSAMIDIADEGETLVHYGAVDNVGNGTFMKTLTIRVDKTAPVIVGSRSPDPNAHGWNNTDVTATFACEDLLSGLLSCSGAQHVTGEGAGQQRLGMAVDVAGNTAFSTVHGINIDKTAPTIMTSQDHPANPAGWNKSDVRVSFSCADSLSGIDACTPPVDLEHETASVDVQGLARDRAGNEAQAVHGPVRIDETAPTVTCSAAPGLLWPPDGTLRATDASVAVSDALSGPDGFALIGAAADQPDQPTGPRRGDIQGFALGTSDLSGTLRAERTPTLGDRTYTLIYQGVDVAGNTATCAPTVVVPRARS